MTAHKWSFYLTLFCLCVSFYSLISHLSNSWIIAPPNYILFLLSLIALIFGIKDFNNKAKWWITLRSWFTVILSLLLCIVLFLAFTLSLLLSVMGAKEYYKTTHSPNNKYSIDFYRWDAGAAGTFGVIGELNGPLWFKKRIFYEQRIEQVKINWENNHTVMINNHKLNLDKGDTFGY
ncbi:hypothetical protein KDN24_17035 [Bacillus sp. Bva_UNVM-123]|uniref:DUF5412 family protein n=1 Tax=Bacillus sp. Bva_UNVM-123 TaxID=2829798 RepID=UPI00391F8D2E